MVDRGWFNDDVGDVGVLCLNKENLVNCHKFRGGSDILVVALITDWRVVCMTEEEGMGKQRWNPLPTFHIHVAVHVV